MSLSTIGERIPSTVLRLQLPNRVAPKQVSVRQADLDLISKARPDFLDTTHFDTVRFPPPPWAEEIFVQAARDGSLAYTPYRGNGQVLETLAANLSEFAGTPATLDELILTPGTQGGLFAALASLVERGNKVAIFEPEYLFSERILAFLGADVRHVPLLLVPQSQPTPDLERLEDEFKRGARVLVFSHPNNPSGAVYSQQVVRKIGELAVKYDVAVVVDELYWRLTYDGVSFPHLRNEPGMRERTITLMGPSKTESLSGYRLGVALASGHFLSRMENIQSILSLRAPAYAQHLLKHWLKDDQSWLKDRLVEFRALGDLTFSKLSSLSWVKARRYQGTAYCWPDVSALNLPGPVVAKALLEEANVLVSPGYQFGPNSAGHFRVCYARDEVLWTSALDRMLGALQGLARHADVG